MESAVPLDSGRQVYIYIVYDRTGHFLKSKPYLVFAIINSWVQHFLVDAGYSQIIGILQSRLKSSSINRITEYQAPPSTATCISKGLS